MNEGQAMRKLLKKKCRNCKAEFLTFSPSREFCNLGCKEMWETSLAMTAKREAKAAERLLAAIDGYCKAVCSGNWSEDGFTDKCHFKCCIGDAYRGIAQKCRNRGYKIRKARKVFVDD